MTLLDLYNLLLKVGIPVSHYEGELDEYPYIVYREFSAVCDTASGVSYRERTRVEITHYSKKEFEPSLELLKETLFKSNIPFSIATTYDSEAKTIINQFEVVIVSFKS